MIAMTMKAMAVLVLPILALAGALAAWPGSSVAAGAPAARAKPAVQQKAPAPPGAEQKVAEPSPPASIPAPEIAKRAEEVTGLLPDLEALAAPGPAIEAIQARLPEVSARLGAEMVSTID